MNGHWRAYDLIHDPGQFEYPTAVQNTQTMISHLPVLDPATEFIIVGRLNRISCVCLMKKKKKRKYNKVRIKRQQFDKKHGNVDHVKIETHVGTFLRDMTMISLEFYIHVSLHRNVSIML